MCNITIWYCIVPSAIARNSLVLRFQHFYNHRTGTVAIIAVTIPSRWQIAISISVISNYVSFGERHWAIATLICVHYGYVDVLRIVQWISNAVAHLRAKGYICFVRNGRNGQSQNSINDRNGTSRGSQLSYVDRNELDLPELIKIKLFNSS